VVAQDLGVSLLGALLLFFSSLLCYATLKWPLPLWALI
jgi:hypothetical protein